MVIRQITFVCDICDRKLSIREEEWNPEIGDLPAGWRTIPPYGDTCAKCCEELDGVYTRIHAPVKAREEAYGHSSTFEG